MANFLVDMMLERFSKRADGQRSLRGTALGSLAVAQVEPEWAEISRAGQRFYGGTQVIASGIAPVTAIPTNTATLALYNGEPDGGKSLLIEELGFCLGSGTPTAGATMFAGVSATVIAAPSAAGDHASYSASRGGKSSQTIWGAGITVTSTKWKQVGSNMQLAAVNVGQGVGPFPVRGLLVPPRYALCIAILSGTGTTPLYSVSAMWSELALDLE